MSYAKFVVCVMAVSMHSASPAAKAVVLSSITTPSTCHAAALMDERAVSLLAVRSTQGSGLVADNRTIDIDRAEHLQELRAGWRCCPAGYFSQDRSNGCVLGAIFCFAVVYWGGLILVEYL